MSYPLILLNRLNSVAIEKIITLKILFAHIIKYVAKCLNSMLSRRK